MGTSASICEKKSKATTEIDFSAEELKNGEAINFSTIRTVDTSSDSHICISQKVDNVVILLPEQNFPSSFTGIEIQSHFHRISQIYSSEQNEAIKIEQIMNYTLTYVHINDEWNQHFSNLLRDIYCCDKLDWSKMLRIIYQIALNMIGIDAQNVYESYTLSNIFVDKFHTLTGWSRLIQNIHKSKFPDLFLLFPFHF